MKKKKFFIPRRLAAVAAAPLWTIFIISPGQLPGEAPRPGLHSVRILNAAVCSQAAISSALHDASAEFQIEPALLYAVIQRESRCEPKAKSHRGAIGLMQLRPATGKALGASDLYEVRANIRAGAEYLALMMKQFDGNIPMALAAYNAGPAAVKKYRSIPPFKETKQYVRTVLSTYEELAKLTKI